MSQHYHIRKASADDLDAVVRHRGAMFTEMGVSFDRGQLERSCRPWLHDALTRQLYHGWLVCDKDEAVIGGAGLTVLPWPPAPPEFADRIAFVYNVYVEPAHRRRGLARRLMETIHRWSHDQGIRAIALHASDEGRPLYASLGYVATNEMRLSLAL